jgi:DNA replication and repair protein RecF
MDGTGGPRLESLRIKNLRNLRSLTVDLSAQAGSVQVVGGNGAGKTTVLEAIYLLARGRTFRGRKAGEITTDGERRTLIEGRLIGEGCPDGSVLVFDRTDRDTQRRFNGVSLKGQAPQESPLRVKLIGENPQILLEGEPALRRALLDWNLFHVEHRLGRWRSDLRRVISQRNAILRQGRRGATEWDPTFVELSERISAKREAFTELWRRHFLLLAGGFGFLDGCDLRLTRGWPMESDLRTVLDSSRATEIERGQTMAGPHRADLAIVRGRTSARFSRGQAKVAVSLLQLAAEHVHRAAGLPPCLWLLDDIEAELDSGTAHKLRDLFDNTAQCFTTRLDAGDVRMVNVARPGLPTFHVEHASS